MKKNIVISLDIALALLIILLLVICLEIICITSGSFLPFFVTLLTIWLIPFVAWYIDKKYLQALLRTCEDTSKFPITLATLRFNFMFAWVIPHSVFLLILNFVLLCSNVFNFLRNFLPSRQKEFWKGIKY